MPAPEPPSDTVLAPRFWVPLGVLVLGALILLLQPLWNGVVLIAASVALLGLFLAVQAAILRLEFTDEALVVSRRDTPIRRFPYEAWLGWKVFWGPVPVIFYFRERNSPHLLPMLFDGTRLKEQLEQRLPPAEAAPAHE